MEKKRQIIHVSMVAFAFLLPFLTRWQALLCATAAFLFNAILMPRIGKDTFRAADVKRGYAAGILLYPVSVFFLILAFPAYIAAGAWAVMALGDGFATLAGSRPGTSPLAWNPKKSWQGSAAFITAGAVGAFALMLFTSHFHGPREPASWFAFMAIFAAVAASTVESLDMSIDDNISVPLISGLTLWLLHFAAIHPLPAYPKHIIPAIALSLAAGGASFALKAVDTAGLIGGVLIGFIICYFAGPAGFAVLFSFFLIGTLCTKVGKKVKESRGIAQEKHGRRGLKHALANCAAGVLFAYLFGCASLGESLKILSPALAGTYWPKIAGAAAIAFIASFAAAAADTVSSELGQVFGKRPVMITTLKPVPHGLNGGITLTGTLLGTLAALAISAIGAALGFLPFGMIWLPAAAGFLGMMFDSLLGALFENSGIVNNELVNLACTASGALFAFAVSMLLSGLLSPPAF